MLCRNISTLKQKRLDNEKPSPKWKKELVIHSVEAAKTIAIREINTDDALYAQECKLRYDVLRVPLGMTHKDSEKFPFESEARHWVAMRDERVVGCVLLYPNEKDQAKLFQMVVAQAEQGKGIGIALVENLEKAAQSANIKRINLHARLVAIDFYRRLGYQAHGPIFAEIGIPHRRMVKDI